VTVILQDVAEVPGKRDAAEDRLVAYIVNERDEHERIVNVMAAIETLKANGFTLSVDTATNRLFVNDDGPYMLAELADQAHMRCGTAGRWRQRTTVALKRGRAFASKRRQTARVRKDAKM
jgi:hypothetical protein